MTISLHLVDLAYSQKWSVEEINDLNGTDMASLISSSAPSVIAAVTAFLRAYQKVCAKTGLAIQVRSEIPVGSGLGSSASYSSCIAAALLITTKQISSATFTEKDLHFINELAFFCESVMHRNPSGVDNSISTFGGCKLFRKESPIVELPYS